MKKIGTTGLLAFLALGVTACGGATSAGQADDAVITVTHFTLHGTDMPDVRTVTTTRSQYEAARTAAKQESTSHNGVGVVSQELLGFTGCSNETIGLDVTGNACGGTAGPHPACVGGIGTLNFSTVTTPWDSGLTWADYFATGRVNYYLPNSFATTVTEGFISNSGNANKVPFVIGDPCNEGGAGYAAAWDLLYAELDDN